MKVDNEIFFAAVEDQLREGKPVKITLVGTSMQPTLCNGDMLTLELLASEPHVGDVVLFRYAGRHLLHRIIAFDGNKYTMRGDNCASTETVSPSDIVARLTSVKHTHPLRRFALRWLGRKGRGQLRPWYFVGLVFLMWAPLNGVGIPLNNYILGLRMDHLLHASVYIPCVLFLWDLFKVGRRKWLSWACALTIGLITEGVQYLLPFRGFDINDLLANSLGVTLGWALIQMVRCWRRQ